MPNYAKFAAPLTELLKVGRDAGKAGSKVRVKWTDECEEAFHHLKAALCEVATLHVPKFDKPFYIRTDASRYAIRATLEQVDEGRSLPSCILVSEASPTPNAMVVARARNMCHNLHSEKN